MKEISLNEGPQYDFVTDPARYAAYVGGLGSGKTFAGIVRGLRYAQQPVPRGQRAPRGVIAAVSHRALEDVVVPLFWDITEGTGLVVGEKKQQKKIILRNGAEVLFRSLDEPDRLRGLELSWFFIDEGRQVTKQSWDVLIGRLRQKGYAHSGWVCSTPNGYDWMYRIFHEKSRTRHPDATWFNASTMANRKNLPQAYIDDLFASYSGKFLRQEVYGEFIGVMSGQVFTEWNHDKGVDDLVYDPELPLYSFWDFGIGELGVVLYAQIKHTEKALPSGEIAWVPELRFVGLIEKAGWGPGKWVEAFNRYCDKYFDGRRPERNIGDPAGAQLQSSSGTTTILALAAHDLYVQPAPRRPPDDGIFILDNMMSGNRVQVDRQTCERLGEAFSSHHWKTDDDGNRIGNTPVHDWTSHFADAARYGAVTLLSHIIPRTKKPGVAPFTPGMAGHLTEQLLRAKTHEWLGNENSDLDWGPPRPVVFER